MHQVRPPSLFFSRRRRTQLSLEATFFLIASINGIVLGYLLLAAVQSLVNPASSISSPYVALVLTVLLAALAILSYQIISNRIIKPLIRLAREATEINSSSSADLLTVRGHDEVGSLTNAFNSLLVGMRSAYQELAESSTRLLDANQQIADSIRYAGMLQKTILPDHQIKRCLGDDYFILWLPRDCVGGDYYLFYESGDRWLAGVVDCAGHGVPGAMMTMMTFAGVDRVIREVGIDSPAAILEASDQVMRSLVQEESGGRSLATSTDIGLVSFDKKQGFLSFAGARIPLFCCNGEEIEHLPGANRSLCERRKGHYKDYQISLRPGYTYYMTTDGYLDQSGGEAGFSLGLERFKSLLLAHATKPMPVQRASLASALRQYRGHQPQRDDITMLSFRLH